MLRRRLRVDEERVIRACYESYDPLGLLKAQVRSICCSISTPQCILNCILPNVYTLQLLEAVQYTIYVWGGM